MATAQDYIQGLLDAYGLGSLTPWAWQQIVDGASPEQVIQSLRQTPEYAARFPGMDQLRAQGKAISENEWISYEQAVRGILHAAGVPPETYDQPQDIARWITADVSVAELQQRVALADQTVSQMYSPEFLRFNGLTSGDLIAGFFLDPDRALPVLKRKVDAAAASTIAIQTGYGQLTAAEGEQLGATVAPNQLAQGFGQLATQKELLGAIDRGESDISRADQLAAVGGDANAAAQLDARTRRRAAAFSGGGGFALGREGFSGAR